VTAAAATAARGPKRHLAGSGWTSRRVYSERGLLMTMGGSP
jgi:hypothetical protein